MKAKVKHGALLLPLSFVPRLAPFKVLANAGSGRPRRVISGIMGLAALPTGTFSGLLSTLVYSKNGGIEEASSRPGS
jgi:hypothetical protein